ncbi:CoxG family protein [Pelagibacterium montanilacus]|uniref:CoxG family protein n=1 Tax=Pelagibacterium montanilacus TaxID=2185280 RepID=UPI0013DFE574|nr:SRPBCC domain-containing protein [Pelagibacterium montanilacus]
MDFGGRYRIGASRQAVWEALNDTAILGACIPGCRSIVWTAPDRLEARIGVNLGVAKPVFTGELVLKDVDPARHYTLLGRGRGGLLGAASASARIALSDRGADTILEFSADGGASGPIMKLGRTLVGASAQGVIDGFFERFGDAMGARVEPLGPDGIAEA